MKEATDLHIADDGAAQRAVDLRRRIKAAGITIAEFRRRSGLSRNVVYALSKGRAIKPEEQRQIDSVLPK
jgi:hypothetical protein